jgi:hypothetical protein
MAQPPKTGKKRPPKKGGGAQSRPGGARKGKRRPKQKNKKPKSLAAVLEGSKPIDTSKDAEEPLTRQEAAQMRRHFRFLREHRSVLRLKVNATEDLLLNEVREPTHRGICQHLLTKVDRSSVLAAAERLDPASTTRLLEGVLRFAPEIEYVLLYLENVKKSASQSRATAELSQGLKQIDFSRVSNAQMRRVLDLVVELFDNTQRPQLMLGLLQSNSFRKAFDQSAETLPDPLSELVVPLRTVQAVILRGESRPHDREELLRGVRLLLQADRQTLTRHPPEVRQKLFALGLHSCEAPDHTAHGGLRSLLESFPKKERTYSELGMQLARHLIGAERDDEARKLLNSVANENPDFQLPRRWLKILDAPRVARFALRDTPDRSTDGTGQLLKRRATWLSTMQPVWIWSGIGEPGERCQRTARLLAEICVPGVAPLLQAGKNGKDGRYFAVPNPGQQLKRVLTRRGGPDLETSRRLCGEAAAILGALGAAGVALPDAALHRFEVEWEDRLWLVDLTGASGTAPEEALGSHLSLARGFCAAVIDRGRSYVPPLGLLKAIETAGSCAALARVMQRPYY